MSVTTRNQVNWAKNTAMRILEDIEQAVIKQDIYAASRWDPDIVYPENRYRVKIGDADALCNTLVCTTPALITISSTHLS